MQCMHIWLRQARLLVCNLLLQHMGYHERVLESDGPALAQRMLQCNGGMWAQAMWVRPLLLTYVLQDLSYNFSTICGLAASNESSCWW